MRSRRRLVSGAVVAAALAALAWLCHSRADALEPALRSVSVWAFLLMTALHLVTLFARSEAWRLALAAVDDRVPPRRSVHSANAGAFLAGAVASQGALPVRVVLLRRLAGDRAPRAAQIAVADAPIFLLELCATALLLAAVIPPAGGLLAAAVLALLAGRHVSGRLQHGSLARGLAVLGDRRRRAGLVAWVSAITALGVTRVAIALIACGIDAGPDEVIAAFGALGVLGLLPLGPSAPAAATVAVAGTGGAALAAGLVLAASGLVAVLAYGAGVVVASRLRPATGVRPRPAHSGAAA